MLNTCFHVQDLCFCINLCVYELSTYLVFFFPAHEGDF